MKKEVGIHILALVLFFILFSFLNNWLTFSYWQFLVGGLLGTLLPDIDHLIYVYFMRPHELTSQRVNYSLNKGNLIGALEILYITRSERQKLIFHTVQFQVIFLILAFLILSTSDNLFGRGIILAFLIHLLVDQIIDIQKTGNLENWFRLLQISLTKNQSIVFSSFSFLVILIFGILF